jgi:hypothetical protein
VTVIAAGFDRTEQEAVEAAVAEPGAAATVAVERADEPVWPPAARSGREPDRRDDGAAAEFDPHPARHSSYHGDDDLDLPSFLKR